MVARALGLRPIDIGYTFLCGLEHFGYITVAELLVHIHLFVFLQFIGVEIMFRLLHETQRERGRSRKL